MGFVVLVFSCSSKKAVAETMQPLSLSAQVGSWKTVPPKRYVSVITTLTNNTSDTLRFIIMSCSWQDAYAVDTKELSIYPVNCDKNIPELLAIPPHGQEQRALVLETEKSVEELQKVKFRVGFNGLTAKGPAEVFEKVDQLRDMRNVVWSAPISLSNYVGVP